MIHFSILDSVGLQTYPSPSRAAPLTLRRYVVGRAGNFLGGKPLRAGAAARRALRQLRAAAREAFLTEDYPVCTANVEKAGQLHRGPASANVGTLESGGL